MPFKLSDYPKNWKDIVFNTASRCIIVDENPQNNAPENLIAFCSACHLSIEHEARRAVLNRGRQLEFFPENTYWMAMERLRRAVLLIDSP